MPTATRLQIPKIADDRLAMLARQIKPAGRKTENGPLHYITPGDLRNEAFQWEPKWGAKVPSPVKMATVRTLHTFGYYGFFKPSVAECIAQIEADLTPEQLVEAVAFEVQGPRDAADLNSESAALNAGFHLATTIVYGRSA